MVTPRPVVLLVLLVLSVACRLTPYALARIGIPTDPAATAYPWNFSPLLPLALFGGAVFADRRLAYLLPLATFLLGDVGILALTGRSDLAWYAYQPLVYAALALVVAGGSGIGESRRWPRIAMAGLLTSTGFFVLTNFAVWALGGTYPRTTDGLLACYVSALPYYRNTLISMAVFLPLLFSGLALRAPTGNAHPAGAPARA